MLYLFGMTFPTIVVTVLVAADGGWYRVGPRRLRGQLSADHRG